MEIPLTRGQVALIDDADYPLVSQHVWRAQQARRGSEKFYATSGGGSGVKPQIWLHKIVLGTNNEVDHIDGNSLNCCRDNLREASHAQNGSNKGKNSTKTSSRYIGVFPRKNGKWFALVGHNYRRHYVGTFSSEDEAARARDDFARAISGGYARSNF
jgi:AP2 domain.